MSTPLEEAVALETAAKNSVVAAQALTVRSQALVTALSSTPPPPPPPPPPASALEWGVNLSSPPPYPYWRSQGMAWVRLRYPLENREGVDAGGAEIAEGMKLSESFGLRGMGTIDTGAPIPSGSSYATYGLPILKAVAALPPTTAHGLQRYVEAFNEPDLKGGSSLANAAPYGTDCRALYEAALGAGIKLATEADPNGLYIPVYVRSYGGQWETEVAKALGPMLSHVNAIGVHMYGTLSATESGFNGNHDLGGVLLVDNQLATAGFSPLARANVCLTEYAWTISGGSGQEGEVPDEATRVKRYTEASAVFKALAAEGRLKLAMAYAREAAWTLTTIEGGTTLTPAGQAFVAGAK